MGDELSPRLMDRTALIQAFPLVSNIMPHVTLEHWTRFANERLAAKSRILPKGLMAIRNRDNYIFGLFAFEVRHDLREYRALWADNIIISSMPGRDLIWRAIIDAIDALAESHACQAVRIGFDDELERVAGDRLWVRPTLEEAGYLFLGARAVKRLPK